jgi:hypothetical protein
MTEPSTVAASAVRPNQPARQVIATFDRYADAEAAVDALADQDFPVHRVAIVGLFDVIRPFSTGLVLAGWGLILRAAVGTALAGFSYGIQRGRRDFDAVSALQPRHYDIVADCAVADEAVRLLVGANRTE